jgi:DNA-binding MarR family transcriptional regulator
MIASMQPIPPLSVETVTDQLIGFLSQLKKSGEAHILGVAQGLDLSFSQMRALFVLSDSQGELAVHELASLIELSVATTGRAVQGLIGVDMVTRREDDHDRRVKRVRLSEHGRQFVDGLIQAHREAIRECLESLSDHEREQLSRALTPILARWDLSTTFSGS